jgi:hypothetical protein
MQQDTPYGCGFGLPVRHPGSAAGAIPAAAGLHTPPLRLLGPASPAQVQEIVGSEFWGLCVLGRAFAGQSTSPGLGHLPRIRYACQRGLSALRQTACSERQQAAACDIVAGVRLCRSVGAVMGSERKGPFRYLTDRGSGPDRNMTKDKSLVPLFPSTSEWDAAVKKYRDVVRAGARARVGSSEGGGPCAHGTHAKVAHAPPCRAPLLPAGKGRGPQRVRALPLPGRARMQPVQGAGAEQAGRCMHAVPHGRIMLDGSCDPVDPQERAWLQRCTTVIHAYVEYVEDDNVDGFEATARIWAVDGSGFVDFMHEFDHQDG